MEYVKTYKLGETELKISTGKLANLASGSVMLQLGNTTVLATTSIDNVETQQDFFPLSVEYIEKMYARGAISGGRIEKREGYPSEEAIIKARQVDHSIRSLFPKSFRKPVMVMITVLTYDQVNNPEILSVMGASLSLLLSGLPFYGPSSGVIASLDKDGKVVINPKVADSHNYLCEFAISGLDGRLLNLEGWGKEVVEDDMDKILDEADKSIREMNAIQLDFVKHVGAKLNNVIEKEADLPVSVEILERIKSETKEDIKKALYVEKDKDTNRQENLKVIKKALWEKLNPELNKEESVVSEFDIDMAVEYVAKKVLREGILKDGKRVTKRDLNQIRELNAEIDLLPIVHGSALFERGLTQSLSIVTLGSIGKEQTLDDMLGERTKNFFHHYNMPPFASGEAGRYNYKPGRREVGHGAIGENALKHMLPSLEEFPYTIRVVSEITTSNGSTSMAATSAASMALMAAGVPMKEAVGGIGVGLITEDNNEDNYKLILDIEGIEDFYGDMDFKVCGTKNGITAIQYENKLRGVKIDVLKEAFRLSKTGRSEVLEVMSKAIDTPRKEVSDTAPVVKKLQIDTENIGMLIGPGGKNIKEIVEKSHKYASSPADVKIDDTGRVMVTALNKSQLEFVVGLIDGMVGEAEVGEEYIGRVDKIMPYGVFVDVTPNISGLLHNSEIFEKMGNYDLEKVFNLGDEIRVKVLKMEDGRINFTIKGVEQDEALTSKISNAPISTNDYNKPRFNDRDRGFNRDSRGGNRGNDRRY